VVTAARNPLHGPERIARWSIGVAEKAQENVMTHYELGTVNGLPGGRMYAGEALYGVITLDLRDGLIQNIYIQVNPAKLHLPDIPKHGAAWTPEP
jgi:RNA polymerase sigma-70 factor (ECF subfamily)